METGLVNYDGGELLLGELRTGNILLMNVMYHKPTKESKYKDYASIVVKDVSTGEKRVITIENPQMIMYCVKPEYRNYTHYPAFKRLDQVYAKRVCYKDRHKEIANLIGDNGKRFLQQCNNGGNYRHKDVLHQYRYVLASDYPYPNYFRIEWMLHYHNKNINTRLTKMFLDIEVDSIKVPGFPTSDVCPINAVSIIDDNTDTVYTFLLRNPENPLIEKFEKDINSFIGLCHETFDEIYGVLDYTILMFDEEIKLIQQLFALINKLKRDFIMIWNMPFDIPYILDRINVLGYNPKDIICSTDFMVKECWYKKDTRNYDFKSKNDNFIATIIPVIIDQLGQYCKLRKGNSELKSVKLGAIAEKEFGDGKQDFTENADIKTQAYVDYVIFVLYSIRDVLLQRGVEHKTHDIDNMFILALTNATQYESIYSQTILLKNRAYLSYFKQGYVIGNNANIDYTKEYDPKPNKKKKAEFEGALVGDPLLNGFVGLVLFGRRSRFLFKFVVDFDYSSMYPNIIVSHNIGVESMIGKLVLNGFDRLNDGNDELYDAGKSFFESILAKDYTHTGNRYFNLPTTTEILDDLDLDDLLIA